MLIKVYKLDGDTTCLLREQRVDEWVLTPRIGEELTVAEVPYRVHDVKHNGEFHIDQSIVEIYVKWPRGKVKPLEADD